MLLWLAIILVVAWLLGWGVFHVAGGLIHLLLVIALVVFLINFISGRRTVYGAGDLTHQGRLPAPFVYQGAGTGPGNRPLRRSTSSPR